MARYSVQSRLEHRVGGAEDLAARKRRVRVPRQRTNSASDVNNPGFRRLAQQRQHRLINRQRAEHVGLPNRAHFIERHVAQAVQLGVLLYGLVGQLTRIQDGRVVDEHVEPAQLFADALHRSSDRSPICHVELERAGISVDGPGRSLESPPK